MWKQVLSLGAALALTVATAAQPPSPAPAQPPAQASVAVPADALGFVSVKVSKLWDNPAAKPLRDYIATQKDGLLESLVGVPFADIDRVTVVLSMPNEQRDPEPIVIVTTREKYTDAKVLKALSGGFGGGEPIKLVGRAAKLPGESGMFRMALLANDRTLVFTQSALDKDDAAALLSRLAARKAEGPLADAVALTNTHDVVAGLDVSALGRLAGGELERDKELAPYLMLLKAKTAVLTADIDKTVKGKLVLGFPDAKTAKLAAPALEDGINLMAAELTREFRRDRRDPIQQALFRWAVRLWKSTNVAADGSNVVVTAEAPVADDLAKLVAVLPKSLKAQAIDATVSSNMKQLALAMHNYHDAIGQFPGDVAPGDKPLDWSWRVQILPYIEQDNLYKNLDLTKQWVAPENLKVLESVKMPKVFEHPGRPAPKGHTYFRILSFPKGAKGTEHPLFTEGELGPKIGDITDGTSNTFMIVEAEEAVPWYKADVLAYDGKLPLPALGGKDADEFRVAFCDGSVRKLQPSKLGEKTLRALITRAGGEVIEDLDK